MIGAPEHSAHVESPRSSGARPYQQCTRCIMDTSDPEIAFDEAGHCNHCSAYPSVVAEHQARAHSRGETMESLVARIKENGKNKPYDCIIGLSGGVDSTYVAYKIKQLGLRPLAVHLDNGWDSELAVKNIEHVLRKLDIDLVTNVLNWEEFKDLQLSFLRASVSDAEIPTDHAIFATLYHLGVKHGLPVLQGNNIVTEAILPTAWTYGIGDWKYISGIHRRFGKVKLTRFPHFDRNRMLYFQFIRGLEIIEFLDHMDYVKAEALEVLQSELGWKYYGGKHYESIYTRFFQGYILPRKFGIDKRRAHLSTLICSGQATRDEALLEMQKEPYPEALACEDREYVVKKLGLTESEFEEIMALPIKTYHDYPSYQDRVPVVDDLRDGFLAAAKLPVRLIRKIKTGDWTQRSAESL